MAKISLLPEVVEPTGAETVVALSGGIAKRVRLSALAEPFLAEARAIVEEIGEIIPIEDARGGWRDVVVDRDGRVLSGFHPYLGPFDAADEALDSRVAALEALTPDVQIVDRVGGWISVEVDTDGRVVRGEHALLGMVPEVGGGGADEALVANALAVAQLRSIRLRDLPGLHPSPPAVYRREGNDPPIADADAIDLELLDQRITGLYAPIVANAPYARGRWITYPGDEPKGAHPWGRRFMTDAPIVAFKVQLGNDIAIYVDGRPLSVASTIYVPNTGAEYWVTIDFGADTQTIHPRLTLDAAGTGYSVGDVLAVPGAAGAPIQIRLTAVNGGVIQAEGWAIVSWGALTALPGAAVNAAGGTGTGARFLLTDNLDGQAQRGHTTRQMRRIEVAFGGGNGRMGRVRVPKHSTVRPWPVAGPRLVTMQDSWGQVFFEHPRGGWSQRMAQRLGIEDVWTNTIGGTGYWAGTGKYITRLPDIIGAIPDDGRPMIFVAQGSINDRAAPSDAAVQDAAEAFWRAAFSALPHDAVMVHVEMMRSAGDVATDARASAATAGFVAACAGFDPGSRRSGVIRTRAALDLMSAGGHAANLTGTGATDYWMSGDGAHLSQAGHDFIGDANAPELLDILQSTSL